MHPLPIHARTDTNGLLSDGLAEETPVQGLVALADVSSKVAGVVNCPTLLPGVTVPFGSTPTTVTLYCTHTHTDTRRGGHWAGACAAIGIPEHRLLSS